MYDFEQLHMVFYAPQQERDKSQCDVDKLLHISCLGVSY